VEEFEVVFEANNKDEVEEVERVELDDFLEADFV